MKRTLKTVAVVLFLATVASAAAAAQASTPVPQGPKVLTVVRASAEEARATVRAAIIDVQQDVEVGNLACPSLPSADPESWNYRIETVLRQVPESPYKPRVCVMMIHGR